MGEGTSPIMTRLGRAGGAPADKPREITRKHVSRQRPGTTRLTEARAIRAALVALGLAAGALSLRTPAPWTGLAFLLTWTVFALAGLATLRRVFPVPASPLTRLVMATALGVASADFLWTVSALAFKRLGPGTVALLCLSLVGLRRAHAGFKGRTPFAPGEA